MTDTMRFAILLAGLGLLALVLFCLSLLIGPAATGVGDVVKGLFGNDRSALVLIVQEIRLPRTVLAAAIGATLGLSGAALQGLLRNPLAEPGLLGISASASLGAVLAIHTGFSVLVPLGLPLAALAGALIAAIIVQALAGLSSSILTIVLAGVAVSSFAGAMTSLALSLSPNPFASLEIVFWMLGSLNDRSLLHVWLSLPFMMVGSIALATTGKALDVLTLGEDTATSVGVDLKRVRLLVIGGTALGVGAATAVAGAIGFIGLIVPHILRPVVSAKPSRLLPSSALAGAALLLAADIAVRLVAPDRDLKIGVLTALIGAPFFLWLVFRYRGAQV